MASASPETKKKLALSIVDFLQTSLNDGTLAAEDRESIEVATSCIGDAFKIDTNEKPPTAAGDQNLLSIYNVYEKLRGKSTPSTEGSSSATEGRPSTPQTSGVKNPEAEQMKAAGNVAMQQKNYQEAIHQYTQAIERSPSNPIYLSNRAAAYSATQQHALAAQDAELAVASDPKYTKAWSRLGLARYALGDAKASMEAYKNGIDAEGNGGSDAMKKGYKTAKEKVEEQGGALDAGSPRAASPPAGGGGGMPDLSSLAGMFGGGGGGGGGMPDLGAMMQNPMMRQMAQNLMQNPETMSNLMNNPRLRDMANQYGGGGGGGGGENGGAGGGGGGMPDIASLMQDPNIAEMAKSFMGGGGGGAGAGAGGGGSGGGAA
ncbi:MAG: hypothetical protein M1828_004486 [Chrysothrix sp. TS-e1954]|nr:MAG: hypothetical protein M1828_004486 [Chrysothrix sp. TS-e1954]